MSPAATGPDPDLARPAPLEDEELLDVVLAAFADVILPELEAAGSEEFVLAQVRSTMSIVGFVRRGLVDRQAARLDARAALATIAGDGPLSGAHTPVELAGALGSASGPEAAAVRAVLTRRLAAEISSRLGDPVAPGGG